MRVFVIRHGESETNEKGYWTGWLDAALTVRGKENAQALVNILSKVHFDKIYSSDLIRAKSTADIAIPGCEYETSPALREVNVGDIAGKPIKEVEIPRDDKGIPLGYHSFGGEARAEFEERIASFMHSLEPLPFENVAIFSHAGWLRGALDFAVGERLPRASIICKNCAIAILEYENQHWKLHSFINPM